MNFTPVETRVLNRIQKDIPLMENPFGAIGLELGLDETTVIETIRGLKDRRTVRNIAGIFEPAGLGYCTTLAALRVNPESVDAAAAAINGHPGVSHNYLRDHHYNIWFTLAEESEDKLASTLSVLAEKTAALDLMTFRNERLFKIGLHLMVGDDEDDGGNRAALLSRPSPRAFSREEREAILLLQHDLPLSGNPFGNLLSQHCSAMEIEELIRIGNYLKNTGYMRRYSAVIRPVHTGYRANAMTAWKPGNDVAIDRIAGIFAGERGITHIYQRTVHKGKWEYPLFAMIHAKDAGELMNIITRLSRESGVGDYQILNTVRELKKEKVIYFSPEFSAWHAKISGVSCD